MSTRDLEFSALGISGEADDLETVLERRRECGGARLAVANKHDLRKVVFDVEIVIVKRVFCSGSRTSSSAAEVSQTRKIRAPACRPHQAGCKGLIVPAFFIIWMI
jgi:hypothetical protein